MRLTTRFLAAVPAVVLAALLSGCTSGAAPEPEVLSATKAGGLYLDAVCPVNGAWDDADVALDRLRLAEGRGDGDEEAASVATALRDVAEASEAAAKRLDPERRTWPASAREPVEDVRETLRSDAKQARTAAKLDADALLAYEWRGAEQVGASAASARAALGLPEDAEAACAQWRDQGERGAGDDR